MVIGQLRTNRQKIGHFEDVLQANLLHWYRETKVNTTKECICQSKICTTTQNKQKILKPGLVASYDIQRGKREGLFLFWHFINLSVTQLLIQLHTNFYPGSTWG